ncbi:MAG: glycoside hydrolase family 3 protein [Alkalispirochaeta sp.]
MERSPREDLLPDDDGDESIGGASDETEEKPDSRGGAESPEVAAVPPLREVPRDTERVERTPESAVEALLSGMSLRERIGQMIMVGLTHDDRGNPLHEINDTLATLIGEVQPGGFALFGPNIDGVDQVRQLVRSMHAVSPVPLLIAVDQEGGMVRRVVPQERMPATDIPPARAVGRLGDPTVAYELGRVIGRELRSLGITMNFAPVADVQTNLENPVIGSRAYGTDPDEVADMVAATVRGLQSEGVSAVVKHFPGHGDTVQDSHDEAATVAHDWARLEEIELVPFRRGIEAGTDAVMIGHIAVPHVSGSSVPATLDAVLVEGILRERLGFDGLIVTDSLVMDGLTRYFDADTIAVRAVQAGADILLLPADPGGAIAAIEAAVEGGDITQERINRSVRRILHAKLRRELLVVSQDADEAVAAEELVPQEVVMGTEDHRGLVETIREGERP